MQIITIIGLERVLFSAVILNFVAYKHYLILKTHLTISFHQHSSQMKFQLESFRMEQSSLIPLYLPILQKDYSKGESEVGAKVTKGELLPKVKLLAAQSSMLPLNNLDVVDFHRTVATLDSHNIILPRLR